MEKFSFTGLLKRRIHSGDTRQDVLTCVGMLAGCTLIGLLFYFLDLSEANIITIYILGILLISATTRGYFWGIISSVVGVLLFNCLFAEPRFTLTVYDPQYTITIFVMLGASLLTSFAMGLLRQQLEREMQETRRSEVLLEMSRQLQESGNEQEALQNTVTQLHKLFECPLLLFPVRQGRLLPPLQPCGGQSPALPEELRLALERWAGQPGDREPQTYSWQSEELLCYKMQTQAAVYAVLCLPVSRKNNVDQSLYNLAMPLLDLAANYLEKERLHAYNTHIAQEAEEERLRANLLRTISHDLRTPLTSIMGNADMLLGNEGRLDEAARLRLYQNIVDDSQWLIGLVENLLFITRMENGAMQVRLEPELLQEVLPEALQHLGKQACEREILLDMPEELLLARMDARLIMQVVTNIVDNAIKYTPPHSRITVSARRAGGEAVVEVQDEGPGIPNDEKAHVFDMFYTANNTHGDARRGIGLGLSLCQSIIAAHGGSICIRDHIPHGAIVQFTLKLEEVHHEAYDTGD